MKESIEECCGKAGQFIVLDFLLSESVVHGFPVLGHSPSLGPGTGPFTWAWSLFDQKRMQGGRRFLVSCRYGQTIVSSFPFEIHPTPLRFQLLLVLLLSLPCHPCSHGFVLVLSDFIFF